MNDMTPPRRGGSLLERAADRYGLAPRPAVPAPRPAAVVPQAAQPVRRDAPAPGTVGPRHGAVDRMRLAEQGYLLPGAPITTLAEELRLVKRQLLFTARDVTGPAGRMILVCSASPNEGKTFTAVNLAISLAAEKNVEVLLIDADFAKPDVVTRLGLTDGPGLLDAIADPALDLASCVIATDVPQLSVLPSGAKSSSDTEWLASARTPTLLAELCRADPRRILLFDSPPVLAASAASVLAGQVGQVLLVVRADRTSESDLKEAVALLDGCEHIQLVLNAAVHGGNRYGSYYGVEPVK